MMEEYELTYSHALELRNENLTDLAMMKKEIQTLKSEIKALGPVNVNAIEDFKNLSERYDFLKGQHDDLVEAEATLVKIIDELDEASADSLPSSLHGLPRSLILYLKNFLRLQGHAGTDGG